MPEIKKYILFRSEASGHHYVYNGEDVIDFSPNPKHVFEISTSKLDEVFNNNRKRTFTTNTGKHVVMFRGTFIEN